MSQYFEMPESVEPTQRAAALAQTLARTCGAAVVLYGPEHGAVWDESDRSVAFSLLDSIDNAGATVIHAGVKELPNDGDRTTWMRYDCEPGERRAWVEFKFRDGDD